ncbi:GNAT family N-acetyltransferase [Streptomyces sp. NPDC057702]|uniref:GNAT family N-acetyltransferase n=1 Tax=unclassified Streptomyces TaxID=2593676 RepID=UPI0036835382
MSIVTFVVPVAEIFDLRWSVLRPGLPRATAAFPEDAAPGVFHLAAYPAAAPATATPAPAVAAATPAAGGPPLACVTLFPDPMPPAAAELAGPPDEAGPAYRFRGLASAPAVRGRGYGAAVLRAGLAEAASRGARWAWCNGRAGAGDFYRAQGFTAVGEEFDLPPAGRHLAFVIKL